MTNEPKISKSAFLKEAINDVLEHIERANLAIERHKSLTNPDALAIQGFERLREQHTKHLDELMAEFGLHLAKEAGEYYYAMSA